MFFFKKKVVGKPNTYELLEHPLDDGGFVPGIRILVDPYNGVIITVSPKVKVDIVGDEMHLQYDFNIVFTPEGIPKIEYEELKPLVGDIIVDIMEKDYDAT